MLMPRSAWKNLPRLFVTQDLAAAATLALDSLALHYLTRVLRRTMGDAVLLCNGRDGEWHASISGIMRHQLSVTCQSRNRPQQPEPAVDLYFALIKREHLDYLLQKATELGVRRLQPLITQHTVATGFNLTRAQAIIREAAEQSERLTLPELQQPMSLAEIVTTAFNNTPCFACLESGAAQPLLAQLQLQPAQPAAFLIGPEGGFSAAEMLLLRECAMVRPVQLGQRILRADTAALAALSCWQAVCGDWTADPDAGDL
jgi:16S rRNA (uracil1498-N3)-methyltransferase